MSDDAKTWAMIHAERKALAATLEGLTPEQWGSASLCEGWTVGLLAAHILAGAEQTPGHFLTGMMTTGFRFNALMERDARSRAQLPPDQIVDRLRQRTTTTNHPPAPVMAMLGEVVVHGEDIRRPAGLPGTVADGAANACLEMYTKASFPVGGKKRIRGLRLAATDTGWSYGAGPEVSGPALSLLLAMTGRAAGLAGLSGDGAAVLSQRVTAHGG
ncbi:MAG TPA: maleylpyruvate isomerase family mycothiol-dependent enzyme [Streptosporangiaceae bacterium]|nr:maleylpyruvate isomerase family mycothiol-dependent enzyme [Streptosporangiaceae bacterium]